jgi:hypothetical protein
MATSTSNQKKMEYKRVSFDINEIAPDAPAGEWRMSIPRGKCKVQPTKEHGFPMIIVPIRLDSTEEEGEEFQKALGTELGVFLVFGGKDPRGEKMSKLRIREVCEAADADLDLIPKKLGDDPETELEPLIRALEGKKFTGWTFLKARKDTGEITTELRFRDLNKLLTSGSDDDDDDDDNDDEPESERAPKVVGKKKPATASRSSNGKNGKRH